MAEIRAFIAVPLSEKNLAAIRDLRRRIEPRYPQMRWIRTDDQIHLTLRFFAALPEEDLDRIHESMLSVGDLNAPFSVKIRGLGGFPRLNRPRVLWLGLEPAAPLLALHRRLEDALRRDGFAPEERPFTPHVTLARARQRGGEEIKPPAWGRSWCGGSLDVNEIILYHSRLNPQGAVHTPLYRVGLNGTSSQKEHHT
jgi:2'-5' RNA ligase